MTFFFFFGPMHYIIPRIQNDEGLTFEVSMDHDEKSFQTTHSLLHPQMMGLELCVSDLPWVWGQFCLRKKVSSPRWKMKFKRQQDQKEKNCFNNRVRMHGINTTQEEYWNRSEEAFRFQAKLNSGRSIWGWNNSIVGRALAFHVVNPSSIASIPLASNPYFY